MNRLFILIVFVFLGLSLFLMLQASKEGTSLVMTPSEILLKHKDEKLNRIRVAGKVLNSPMSYVVEPEFELRFHIQDPGSTLSEEGEANAMPSLPVVYFGLMPDMFAGGRDVILDGDFSGGTFHAKKLLTQCPSKYEAPKPGEEQSQEAAYKHPEDTKKEELDSAEEGKNS